LEHQSDQHEGCDDPRLPHQGRIKKRAAFRGGIPEALLPDEIHLARHRQSSSGFWTCDGRQLFLSTSMPLVPPSARRRLSIIPESGSSSDIRFVPVILSLKDRCRWI